ncbi:hypothetical protein [Flavobacterium alkalisoli]|uniref:hypothetical protein n=1 Tax=Flavobacterium alkalisoli TaxID=2602769 RepID=UPI003A8E4B02
MKKHTLFTIVFLALSATVFAQNKAIEKVWQLDNIYADVHMFSALDKLMSGEDIFELKANGDVVIANNFTYCGTTTKKDATAKETKTQVIGKWNWINSTTIEMETLVRGLPVKKKYKVSKVNNDELILIDLH